MSEDLCLYCNEPLYDPDTGHSRIRFIEVQGVYDGGLFLTHAVPGCEFAWHRWTSEDMRSKAQPYIKTWNERHGYESYPL